MGYRQEKERVVCLHIAIDMVMDHLTHVAETYEAGALAENLKGSMLWGSPSAVRFGATKGVKDTAYDACCHAGARQKGQRLRRSTQPLDMLRAKCHHMHAPDEWQPVKSGG